MKIIHELDENFVCEITAECFQVLTNEQKKLIHDNKTQILFKKGDTLTKQSAFSSAILFVIEGAVKTYIETPDGKNYNFALRGAGSFIGLASAFLHDTYLYSSSALTDTHVIAIEKHTIHTIIKSNGEFAHNLLASYCNQNATMYSLLAQLLHKQMNGRLADTLMYIHNFKEEYKNIFQLMTRKDIAEFTGITVESTVKLLKSFEKDGIILLQDKDIQILNMQALHDISKRG